MFPNATAVRVTDVSPERAKYNNARAAVAARQLRLLPLRPRGAEPARLVRAIRAARRRDPGRVTRTICPPCPQALLRSPERPRRAAIVGADRGDRSPQPLPVRESPPRSRTGPAPAHLRRARHRQRRPSRGSDASASFRDIRRPRNTTESASAALFG